MCDGVLLEDGAVGLGLSQRQLGMMRVCLPSTFLLMPVIQESIAFDQPTGPLVLQPYPIHTTNVDATQATDNNADAHASSVRIG